MMTSRSMRRAALVGLAGAVIALSSSHAARADFVVERGWDLFQTVSGTVCGVDLVGIPLQTFNFNTGTLGDFGRGIGVQPVDGADTIVKRLDTVTVGGAGQTGSTRLEMEALGLRTKDQVDFLGNGRDFYYETLQSQRGGQLSTGMMNITFNDNHGPGVHGIFSSTLNIYFDIRKGNPLTGAIVASGVVLLTGSGTWSHFPEPGKLEIRGVNAFLRDYPPGVDRSRDFWPSGVSETGQALFTSPANLVCDAAHSVVTVPEPASIMLFGLGTFAMVVYGWRRRKQLAERSQSIA